MPESNDEELWESAENWKAAAIAIAVITPCACSFFLHWIFAAPNDAAMLQRVQMVGAVAAFAVALITFCTVVWRGVISTQQAKLQRLQIDKLSTQIAATEVSNLATLLQKGAELIAEVDKPARVAAGIASLRAVGEGTDEQFGVQAMEIIADYIQQRGTNVFSDQIGMSATMALALIHEKTNRIANRIIEFEFDPEYHDPEEDVRLQLVTGVVKVRYYGGYFDGIELTEKISGRTQFKFDNVRFLEGYVDFRCGEMVKCNFNGISVIRFDSRWAHYSEFVDCNFSDCQVNSPHTFPDLRGGKNWFYKTHPPVSNMVDMNWGRKLHIGRPTSEQAETDDDTIFTTPDR